MIEPKLEREKWKTVLEEIEKKMEDMNSSCWLLGLTKSKIPKCTYIIQPCRLEVQATEVRTRGQKNHIWAPEFIGRKTLAPVTIRPILVWFCVVGNIVAFTEFLLWN